MLIKVYGWLTLGVYLGLTAADLPLCFLFVRAVGTEAIGKCYRVLVSEQAVDGDVRQSRARHIEQGQGGDPRLGQGGLAHTLELRQADRGQGDW